MALPPFRGKEGIRIANRRLTPLPRPEESRFRQYLAFSTRPSREPSRHFRRDVLGDSHFSLQHRPGLTELATAMDCVELFHATSHGDGTRGFIVAVPSSQPGDDPACRREA